MSEIAPIPPQAPKRGDLEVDRLPLGLRAQQVGALALIVGLVGTGVATLVQKGFVEPGAHVNAGQDRAATDGFAVPRADYDGTRYLQVQVHEDEACTVGAFVNMDFRDEYAGPFFRGSEVTEARYEVMLPTSLDEPSVELVEVTSANELQGLAVELGDDTVCGVWEQYREKFPAGPSDYDGFMEGKTFNGRTWTGLP